MLHHHLLPMPGTGRERNMVYDAGDTLEVLQRCKVNLVLVGPQARAHAWRFENLFVVNAGTVCSLRLRGKTRPCYNIVTIGDDEVPVERKYPFHGSETIIEFAPSTLAFETRAGRRARRRGLRRGRRGARAGGCGREATAQRPRRAAAPSRPRRVTVARPRAVALIDGEHYPPVVADALRHLSGRYERRRGAVPGRRREAAAAPRRTLGAALYAACPCRARRGRRRRRRRGRAPRAGAGLGGLLAETGAVVVVDLSDEPVLGYPERFHLISVALTRGARYVGADFEFSPPP